jgi:hypothetical protein
VGASHLSLVTLELRGQSRNSLLQLAALPLDRHEAGAWQSATSRETPGAKERSLGSRS